MYMTKYTRKPSRCTGKRATAVRAWRPLAKISTVNQLWYFLLMVRP